MQVRKAVITAAGRGSADFPAWTSAHQAMLPMVDRDGLVKPVVQIIAEEALDSGIEEICLVTAPGDEAVYRSHFQTLARRLATGGEGKATQEQQRRLADFERRLSFAVQDKPEGYGHAVWCAREFVGGEPFLLLVSDHLYVSGEARRCARQVIDLAVAQDCAVAAVQATREHLIHQYGTVAGKRVSGLSNTFQIEHILEKPTPTAAEQLLHVPGLRVGHYLCFFGIHVLTPTIFSILDEHVERSRRQGEEIQLTPALQELACSEKYLAVQTNGRRYNIGVKFGSLEAQIALAMAGRDRDELLIRLMELLLQAGVRNDE
ncbi:MAG TPA: sugar phosphate nucleotidyltransferase [Phycisphaerae bacterium]|nr:sugar phosphate nucleotidyltransferase [Phycisphaerae bacterium]HOQ87138.1 sugar phosphate nucleotidyltransferase [Phycisphaerae bacterium]